MASVQDLNTIQDFYIAYYQRPGDPSGLLYWADRLEAPGGSLEQVADAFGNSPESQTLYGPINAATIGTVIDEIYLALFDRLPDPIGKAFYTAKFLDGTYSAASIAYRVLVGAQNADAVTVQNKEIAADRFSETVDGHTFADPLFGQGPNFNATYAGDADAAEGRDFLDPVTSNPATIPSEQDTTLFIQNNVADPGDPIISSQVQKNLTIQTDFIDLHNSPLMDVVVGVQAPGILVGTYTNGDTILGGGNTELRLFADGQGDSTFHPIATLQNLGLIDVVSVSDTYVEAVGFTNIPLISETSGSNGNFTFFNNLDRDTTLFISNVTGSLSASFDVPGYQAYARVANFDPGGPGGQVLVDSENNADVTIGDSMSASATFSEGNLHVGNLNAVAGDNSFVEFRVDADNGSTHDAVVGDVTVDIGNSSTFTFDGYASDDFTVGNFDVHAGDSASLTISIDAGGDVTVGNIDMVAGSSSDINIDVTASGSIDMADITLTAGGSSDITVTIEASGSANVGNIDAEAGDSSDVDVYISGSGDTTVGDVSLIAGNSSDLTFQAFAPAGDITVGNVVETAGDDSDAEIFVTNDGGGAAADVTVGNIDVTLGDNGFAEIFVTNSGDGIIGNAGNIDVGNVTAAAGDSSTIEMFFYLTADSGDVGNLTVGDISAIVGDSGSVSLSISSSAGESAGDLTVGDVHLEAGNGTTLEYVTVEAFIGESADDGLGNMTVGDATLIVGDFGTITYDVYHYNSSDGDIGSMTIGDIDVQAGEAAFIDITVEQYESGSGDVGDLTVGDISVGAGQDTSASIEITAYDQTGDLGNVTVGDITVLNGDNQTVSVSVSGDANDGNAGTMTVGDISIAVSATTTVDLSGNSSISVSIDHHAYGSHDLLGALTVGDISLSAGDGAYEYLTVSQTGAATLVDDMSVGVVSMTVGDTSTAYAYFSFHNSMDNGNLGDFSLGGLDVVMGDSSFFSATINITNNVDGDVGNVSIGNMTFDIGASSTASLSVDISVSHGSVGDITFGDLTAVIGDSGSLSMESMEVNVGGDIGSVTFGDMDLTLGVSASMYWSPDITSTRDIGDITVGDISAVLADSAYLSISLDVTAASGFIGDIAIGDIDMVLGASAEVGFLDFTFSASRDIGATTIGDLSITAGIDSSLYASVTLSAGDDVGNLTAGDVSINADGGSTVSVTYEINAGGHAGALTVGDIDIVAVDNAVPAGASIFLLFGQHGTGSEDLTLGNISVDLDTLSVVTISIDQTNSGNVILGDLTVSGTSGTFDLSAHITTGGDITIGDVDYSGFDKGTLIDTSWTDFGAGKITGTAFDDQIRGNNDDNLIIGGKGVDTETGKGGADTFQFLKGDALPNTPDSVTDWTSADDFLSFGLVNGTSTNYVENGSDAGTLAQFLLNAADELDSTVKYYAQVVGADVYVAANQGSGEADSVVKLVGVTIADIGFTDIHA